MLNTRRLTHLLSLSAAFLASGLPLTGCCDTTTFEISAELLLPFSVGELERQVSVRALGDRVRLEFSEPVLVTASGQPVAPCSTTSMPNGGPMDQTPPPNSPEPGAPVVSEGGAGGQMSLGGAAGASTTPELLGGASALGGLGGMTVSNPPATTPPIVVPPTYGAQDGYVTCVQLVGYNLNEVVQVTRRAGGSYGRSISLRGTAIDEVDGCGVRKPTDQGIVLRVVD